MEKSMNILFINGSPNREGNTAALAKLLLKGKSYEILNLVDYFIGSYGQEMENDGLDEVIFKMQNADVVIGSPVYWYNLSESVRNVLDRFYGKVEKNAFLDHKLYFIFQGAGPEKWMLEATEFTMKRFASLYGFAYCGMITNEKEAIEYNKTF